ncbi:hypothetical protein P167DRAFT_535690 [Morchella conica CCBAS932]|uniref:GPI inositol-deacylase winged helix domain-containing protein n=1 Tax=Morchella conica CCBAS932 TaxID=1392247 RepID=A0A3N4L3S9_9PEZI|nr:hypothetical protein P167DRAFT_535690 [Morchella conica CCBAS932]
MSTDFSQSNHRSNRQDRNLYHRHEASKPEINRQNKDVIDLALRVFSWLLEAIRVLTVKEIKIAVSVQPSRYELDELDLPNRPTLLEVCSGLVTIDEETDTVRFAHYTVQEYLVEKPTAINTGSKIGIICGTYLCFDKLAKGCPPPTDYTPALFRRRVRR